MQLVTFLALSCCLVVGMMTGLLAYLKLWLARNPAASPPRAGLMLWLLNLAVVVLMVVAGALGDTLGTQPVLIGGAVLLALSLFLLGAMGNSAQAPYAVAFAAFGTCALYVCSLLLMPRGLLGEREVASSLTFGLVFVALGALVIAPLFDILHTFIGYRLTMTLLGAAALAPVFLAAITDPAHFQAPGRPDLLRLVADSTVWLAGMVFFLYAPLEGSISVWAAGYCASHREDPGTDASWMGWFWVAFAASRVLFGLLLHVFGSSADAYQNVYLVVPAVLAAACLGNMLGSARHHQAFTGLLLLGVCLGPILPTLLAIVFKMKGSESGPATALGLLFACGAGGSFVGSFLPGGTQAGKGGAGLSVPLFISIVLLAAALFFALMGKE